MIVRNKVHFNESDDTEPSVFLIAPEGLFSFEIHAVKESKTGREASLANVRTTGSAENNKNEPLTGCSRVNSHC